jgi:DNA-binding MarR family transcriptional regulator
VSTASARAPRSSATNLFDIVQQLSYRQDVARGETDVAAAERALERLFRLTSSRKLQSKQTAVVGADVTRAGYAVLRCVDVAGELSLGDVARQCSMDPAAAGRQVKNLEDDGLLERRAGADDGRVTVVRLTAVGRRVYRRIVDFRTDYMTEVLANWPAQDRADLVRLVDRLVDDLKSVPVRARSNGRTRARNWR